MVAIYFVCTIGNEYIGIDVFVFGVTERNRVETLIGIHEVQLEVPTQFLVDFEVYLFKVQIVSELEER